MAVTTAIVASTVYGAVSAKKGASKAAKASTQAADTATAEQRRQYDDMTARNRPFEQLGGAALGDINAIYGRSTGADGTVTSGGPSDMSRFFTSPDYQFNLEQGQQAVDRSMLARGRGLSGAAVKEGTRFASGLASGEFGNYMNRLYAQAGIGQNATNATNAGGMASAANIGNIAQNAGNARAGAYMAGAQGVNNAVQGGVGNYLLTQYLRPQSLQQEPFMANNYRGSMYGGLA